MTRPTLIIVAVAALALAACAENGAVTSSNVDPISFAEAPPDAAPGTCWDKTVSPAVVETVKHKVLLKPAQVSNDGRVQTPPVYRTETRQQVVTPRQTNWTEVLCPNVQTPEFLSSIQRALAARGYYAGPINGDLDAATAAAVQRYQQDIGIASVSLTPTAARQLGLITVENPSAA